jgi:hypothetical protein
LLHPEDHPLRSNIKISDMLPREEKGGRKNNLPLNFYIPLVKDYPEEEA